MEQMDYGRLQEMSPEEAAASYQEYFKYLTNNRKLYIDDCNKFYDAGFGNIYSQEELDEMELVGQYPVKLNRPLKYITTITGMMTSTKPMFRAYPNGTEDNAVSAVCNKILHHIYKRSKGLMVMQRAIFHSLLANMGYISVGQSDRNFTSFWFSTVEDIVVSTDAKDPFFTDASCIYTHKWMTKSAAAKLYNIKPEEISESAPDELIPYFSGMDGQKSIIHSHMYDDTNTLVKIIEGEHRVISKEMMETVDADGQPSKIWTGKTAVTIVKKTLIGYNKAFVQTLPATIVDHHDIPIYAYDTKNTFKLGLMSRLYEYSRLANKFFAVMMLNAQLASNPKIFVFEGQIPENDVDGFADTYAQPGSINVLAGTGGKESVPPVIVQGQPISSAWFQLVQSVVAEMEFSAIPNMMMGMDTTQTNRVSHIFEQYQMTIESIRTFLNIFENCVSQVGKVALQYFVTYNKDQIAQILKLEDIQKRIQIGQQKGYQYDDNSQLMQKTMEETGSTAMLESDITKFKQDIDTIKAIEYITSGVDFTDFDIEVVKGSYLPSHSILKFFQKLELFRMGAVDNESLIEDSDMEDKDKIINRISTIKQLNNQVLQQTVEGQKQQSYIEELQKKLAEAEHKLIAATGEFKYDKHVTQQRAKDSAMSKIEKMRGNLQRTIDSYNSKAQVDEWVNKIEKAIMEYEMAKKNVESGGDGFPRQIDIGSIIAKINEGQSNE